MRKSIVGMILAGGEGTRLYPLTQQRAKPAVPFGGKYRIIDFVLSNFVNSGINKIFVITQFKSQSLTEHIIGGWNTSTRYNSNFIIPVPAQMQTEDRHWYQGTADAIMQNIHLIEDFSPELVAIFGGDHIYRMDISQMADFHENKGAVCTVAAIPVPVEEASEFGIIQVDKDWKIIGFQEKPKNNPITIPGNDKMALASMGNYIFNSRELVALLKKDAKDKESSHDFGKNILPSLVEGGQLFAYNFNDNIIPGNIGEPYWRDVGTLKAYFEANMDLRTVNPQLDLYNDKWPIFNYNLPQPPAKFVHNEEVSIEGKSRIGKAINSIVSAGCIISGATIVDSILFNAVRVRSYAVVRNSILINNVIVGENCRIRNAIIDKHNEVPENTTIGFDRKSDSERYTVIDLDPDKGTWLTVVAKKRSKLKLPKQI